ncbi:MAG: interleukin-like EMT inducer domain-containing protein [Candidatus Nanohaloarchaea archaeon]|nr:interleukin-like EMT inducer domain-containing protein [Candidatus Nanohaloarchaea archaeon]
MTVEFRATDEAGNTGIGSTSHNFPNHAPIVKPSFFVAETTQSDWSSGTLSGVSASNGSLSLAVTPYSLVSVGLSSTSEPRPQGLYDGGGNLIARSGRSYMVSVLDTSTNTFDSHTTYDVYGSKAEAGAMADALNALPNNGSKIVLIHTYDEPQRNRLSNGSAEAMYAVGASTEVYGSSNFKYRSAYALVGRPGIGEGNAFLEAYAGDVDSDTDAWVDRTWRGAHNMSGSRVTSYNLSSVGIASGSLIRWDATLPAGTSITVETSLDGGATWQQATNGGNITGISSGTNLTGTELLVRIRLETTDTTVTPQLHNLVLSVSSQSDGPTFSDSPTEHAFTVSASAIDTDAGNSELASCTVRHVDQQGNQHTTTGTLDTSYGGNDEARCTATVNASYSGYTGSDTLDVTVVFQDQHGATVQTTTASHAFPNHVPSIASSPTFANSSTQHTFNISAVGKDTDAGSSELSSCTVTHSDGESTYATAGNLDTSYGTTDEASCELRIAAEVEGGFSGYLPGERISVDVRFTDVHGATVTTSQTSNPVPNRKPEIHPPILTFPSAPDVLDNVTARVNTSDVGDPVRYANFTVWEYNQDTENRVFVNENGTMWRNGSFQLWNATEFQADLENATYNFSLTVSDGYAEVRRSGKLFTLEAVKPDVSELSFYRPDPWGVAETWFRPGQGLGAYVTVTDANGRGDIVSYGGQAIDPNGQTFTMSSFNVENQVLNGYNLSIFYSVPDDAVSGDWDMRITATDEDGLQGSNRSTFHVTRYTSVTASVEQSLQNDTVYVDGNNVSDGVYTDSEVSFPYAVRIWRRLLTGVINYGRFTQLTVDGQRLTMTQEFADNQFLLPATEASLFDLEQLEDQFTGGLLSGRSFLENAVASIGYGTTDEKTVRVAARFEKNERIQIHGFDGSLSSGIHELLIEKEGVENRSMIVSVELVR